MHFYTKYILSFHWKNSGIFLRENRMENGVRKCHKNLGNVPMRSLQEQA